MDASDGLTPIHDTLALIGCPKLHYVCSLVVPDACICMKLTNVVPICRGQTGRRVRVKETNASINTLFIYYFFAKISA